MKKTNKILIIFITIIIINLLLVMFCTLKIGSTIKSTSDLNGVFGIKTTKQIITLGTTGMPHVAETSEEAKKIAEQYFTYVDKNEQLFLTFKKIKEDNRGYFVTYSMPVNSNTREYYFKYKLQTDMPKNEANVTLFVFKKSFYNGNKLYANRKSDVKTFGDLAILYRKLNYGLIDRLITSSVKETKNEYIYTAYVKSTYLITSKNNFDNRYKNSCYVHKR